MLTRDRHIVEKNIYCRMAPRHGRVLVEQKACAKIRPAPHNQQSRTRRESFDCLSLIDTEIGHLGADHRVEIFAELLRGAYLGVRTSLIARHSITRFVLCGVGTPITILLRYRSMPLLRTFINEKSEHTGESPEPLQLIHIRGSLVRLKKLVHLVRINPGEGTCGKRR